MRAITYSAREVCSFVRLGRKNPKNEEWNFVKASIGRKEAAGKTKEC